RKDGTRFLNAVMIAPIFDADGRLDCFLGSQVEVVQEAEQPRSEVARGKIASLSRRQREILTSIAAGKLNKQIAWELSLSERTVKLH
ncbi:LuxR C-terminal-related transcriptional regulator, partial [Streptomyces brasiliscabiei]|uniref:LuxR C-terminal-related transcriptional regulator n=1 Tax=Streptomyces brasiliscabiei TaxID=2736302 RepID=UPI0030156151